MGEGSRFLAMEPQTGFKLRLVWEMRKKEVENKVIFFLKDGAFGKVSPPLF